ncbi:NAD(P)/FAD-dependent oxidoreductase [Parabacteroides sp. AM08-6]|uniref:protoporphyrinogen/coproporphyrinogen oxidase n=1 Tax=Parabacteroides sp. AM08-6 TaxID=2292053 RepID=UPI000F001409|nr:FAD-dependent oxidoreductase [Parabacteroides sp. AM08-6]RHJ85289.1 LPS biosynthesis protein [Parabacteroides sp. AM08-6]
MDLIIGAGVSGIAYANYTNHPCEIIEKESEIGGYCRTIKRNGFVWDYSGHFFHFRHPEIKKLVSKNIEQSTLSTVQKKTSILYNGQYIDFPFQKNIHQLPKDEFIDCLYDLFAATPIEGEYSFKEMVYSHYGKSIAEKFLIPYNEKLYACDLNTLDQEAMGRFFPKAGKEEIVLNFKNEENDSYNQIFVYPKGGAIEYIHSLAKNIKETPISLKEELISIDTNKKIAQTNRRTLKFDNLISTMPFPKLLDKCGIQYDKGLFTCNKVLVLNIGFDRKGKDTKSSWIYIPDKDVIFYRVGYYDNIMQSDRMSVYVEIGFPENAQLKTTNYYIDKVIADMIKCGLITDQKVVDYEAIIMDPAYVHINKKSVGAVKHFKALLEKKKIYSIGRYGSWTYCSIEDNIVEARDLALKIK